MKGMEADITPDGLRKTWISYTFAMSKCREYDISMLNTEFGWKTIAEKQFLRESFKVALKEIGKEKIILKFFINFDFFI